MSKGLWIGLIASVGLLAACSPKEKEMTMESKQTTSSSMMEAKESTTMADNKPSDGKSVTDFSLEGVDGKTYRLSDFKGKKVYIKFWASWCSICLASLAETDELAMNESDDVVVLSVVSPTHNGEKSAEEFKKWYTELDYKHLPVLLDPSGELLKEYQVHSYPTAAFIDSQGFLVKTHIGYADKATVEGILAEIQ